MGNCLFGAAEPEEPKIQVSTSTGAIMEFEAPITAACIVKEFPGHFLFKSHDLFWKPLSPLEELHPGESYCLLKWAQRHAGGHVRSKSIPMAPGGAASKPYRMSFDSHGVLKRSASTEVSRIISNNNSHNSGVWKVKLVISPEQLVEILSQQNRTEELIENVRSVAKCGASRASSMDLSSDQWSVSSRNSYDVGIMF
ncbi:hypothetical protein V2J09_015721 [Rumex salicifolius]